MSQRLDTLLADIKRVDGNNLNEGREKHSKMSANPFRFMRGAAQLYYSDIKSNVLPLNKQLKHAPATTIVGDCHLSNFGFLSEEGSHTDKVIFTVNDFDDACVGNPFWDIHRFLVSIALAVDLANGILDGAYQSELWNKKRYKFAVSKQKVNALKQAFINIYCQTLGQIVKQPDTIYSAIDNIPHSKFLCKQLEKARSRSPKGEAFLTKSTLAKLVEVGDGKTPIFKKLPGKLLPMAAGEKLAVNLAFRPYVDDDILDVVKRQGAGTGSVNVERYYLLVGPSDFHGALDLPLCHVVEVKQQRTASPILHFPDYSPVNKMNPAHLTLDCQRVMQRRPDIVLDEVEWQGNHYLVRSRHHARVNIDPEQIFMANSVEKATEKSFEYIELCAQSLALAHARGDRRSTRFEQKMLQIMSENESTLLAQNDKYCDQVNADFRLFSQWFKQKG